MNSDRAHDTEQVTLWDGTGVTVRPLTDDDVQAVIELHRHQLTAREQYLRFFIAEPTYLDTFARKVVRCDDTQCALGAFESGRLIGLANYVATTDPGVAEVAVAVAHADHLRGVATVLLQRLADLARAHGIDTFTAEVLADNAAMLRVLHDAGWRHTTDLANGVLTIGLDLSAVADPYGRGSINVL